MRIKTQMTLPVLVRELAQLAARRSTYVSRGVVAGLFYAIALLSLYTTLHRLNSASAASVRSILGGGKMVMMLLTGMVTTGIYLILPAMVVGTITSERENGTLDLMLVTRLNPWEIVFQKLFARLVPMLSILLLTTPFMAVAYSLGGVSAGDIAMALASWTMTSLKLAALAIMCSAFSRSTVAAFFTTYGILFAMTVAIPFMGFFQLGWLWVMIAGSAGMGNMFGRTGIWIILGGFAVGFVFVGIYMALARVFIVRAGRRSKGGIKASFRRVDSAMERINRGAGRRRWGRASGSLPDERPVAWRERSAAVVCTPRYLFRLLAVINVPMVLLLLIFLVFALLKGGRESVGFSILMAIIWVPVALALCIYVSNLMSKERANQTMEVLLTTPLTAREILTQKLAAVPRLCWVIATPLIMTMLFEAAVEMSRKNANPGEVLAYAILTLVFMAIYLYAITWITFACSLKPRRRAQVVAMAVARIFAIVVIPLLLAALLEGLEIRRLARWLPDGENLIVMSPMVLLGMLEFDKGEFFKHSNVAFVNALFYLSLAFIFRARALRWARLHLRKG
ncbi:MAG: ABC transporter permease subunit [Lentisphaerae bacterium]|nr:ABC transporter permease subunit [Lentisphaerota bacterium]